MQKTKKLAVKMVDLLLELYSEEMPIEFFDSLEEKINDIVNETFLNFGLINKASKKSCQVYFTPCRLTLYMDKIPLETIIKYKEIIGPKVDGDKEEIKGFLNAFNLRSVKDLKKLNGNYVLIQSNLKVKTEDILKNAIAYILNNIIAISKKNTRWISNSAEAKWISPLRNILCLFNNNVFEFEYCGLKSNNSTYGHKKLVGFDKKIIVKGFTDYKSKIKSNYVIFDQNEREKIIINEVQKIKKDSNLDIFYTKNKKFEQDIIKIITNTTEYPQAYVGEFNSEFLNMPNLIITNILCDRYNCLCLADSSSNSLTNKFILFTNTKTDNNGKHIVSGLNTIINNKLLFMNSELTKFLSENLETKEKKLKSIPYHRGFGALYDKVERLVELSKFICLWIPYSNLLLTEQSAELCRIDLATNLTKNNADLKGYLPSYYARINNYPKDVCDGIEDCYLPQKMSDPVPSNDIGKILSIADKVDSIITLFITNDDTNDSKSTYNIRKNTSLIIKIIIESNINIPIDILLHKSISIFKTTTYKINIESGMKVKNKITEIEYESLKIFRKRFIEYVEDFGFKRDLILSVINTINKKAVKQAINLNLLYKKITKIDNYIKGNENKFIEIRNAQKRLSSILKDFNLSYKSSILTKLFNARYSKTDQENLISSKVKEIRKQIKEQSKLENYEACLDSLFGIVPIINEYFKNNVIKSKNAKETRSRMLLLYKVKSIFDGFLNFSEFKK